jgi:ubiquinone/menaquinone biosynthesis C-methylase UbiE
MRLHASHGNRPGAFQGRRSRIYDFAARRLLRGFYRRIADDLARSAPDHGSLLDVGTGPGVLLMELAHRRPRLQLTGIDLSSDMVAAAERNLGAFGDRATARVADVVDLPFPDESFDLIVSSMSLHHWDQPEAAVAELARVLRPGGRVYIYDFRFAPFDKVTAAARENPRFSGQAPERTSFRGGHLHLPRRVKYVLTAGPQTASAEGRARRQQLPEERHSM